MFKFLQAMFKFLQAKKEDVDASELKVASMKSFKEPRDAQKSKD